MVRKSIDLMKENGFTLAKEISRRYSTPTITDRDYADDTSLLANTLTQADSLLPSLKRAAGGIGLHVNAEKTDYMCFYQRGDISPLNSGSLKLEKKFTYLGSGVSSTENDINTWLANTWIAIERPTVIFMSDRRGKINRSFFASSGVNTAIWMHHVDAD